MTDVVQLNVSWKTERDGTTHTIVRNDSDSNDFEYSNSNGLVWNMSLGEIEHLTTQLLQFVPQSKNLSEGKPKNHNLPWSEDDDQLLRNLWNQQVELPVFISTLHRTEPSIKLRLKYLGIVDLTKTTKGSLTPQGPQRGNLPWDDHEDEILINLYEEGSTISKMSETLERTEKSVKTRMTYLGLR